MSQIRSRSEISSVGIVTWRLINMLSLNYLGLVDRGAGKNAAALREMLSLFADFLDDATERKIRGLRSVDSRPVVRGFGSAPAAARRAARKSPSASMKRRLKAAARFCSAPCSSASSPNIPD